MRGLRVLNEYPVLWLPFIGLMVWLIWSYISRLLKADNEQRTETFRNFFHMTKGLFIMIGTIILLVVFLTFLSN